MRYECHVLVSFSFVFFKLKTAYEMRISDWSSDVCSSDLATPPGSAASKPPATLAAAAFPRRVRRLLEGILEYASDEMERILGATLNDAEQQLFKLAEQARSNEVQQQIGRAHV